MDAIVTSAGATDVAGVAAALLERDTGRVAALVDEMSSLIALVDADMTASDEGASARGGDVREVATMTRSKGQRH